MDKLTQLVYKLSDLDLSILDIDDQLEEIGIQYQTPDDEHWYWYSDDIEYEDGECGAYDIEDLPYNMDGSINQSVYDELVDVITKYINENSN